MGMAEDCEGRFDKTYGGWVDSSEHSTIYRYYSEETQPREFILSIIINKIIAYRSVNSVIIDVYNTEDFFSNFPNITNNEKHMFELRFGVPLDGLLEIIK